VPRPWRRHRRAMPLSTMRCRARRRRLLRFVMNDIVRRQRTRRCIRAVVFELDVGRSVGRRRRHTQASIYGPGPLVSPHRWTE